jgi:hypothetical protein
MLGHRQAVASTGLLAIAVVITAATSLRAITQIL